MVDNRKAQHDIYVVHSMMNDMFVLIIPRQLHTVPAGERHRRYRPLI